MEQNLEISFSTKFHTTFRQEVGRKFLISSLSSEKFWVRRKPNDRTWCTYKGSRSTFVFFVTNLNDIVYSTREQAEFETNIEIKTIIHPHNLEWLEENIYT